MSPMLLIKCSVTPIKDYTEKVVEDKFDRERRYVY